MRIWNWSFLVILFLFAAACSLVDRTKGNIEIEPPKAALINPVPPAAIASLEDPAEVVARAPPIVVYENDSHNAILL